MVTVFPSICHVTLVGGEPVEMQTRMMSERNLAELTTTILGRAAERQKGYYFNRIQWHLRLTRTFYWQLINDV